MTGGLMQAVARAVATRSGPILAAVLASVPPAPAAEPVVPYTIVDGRAIPASLTGAPGDALRGRMLYAEDPRTGCPACHGMPGSRDTDAGAAGTPPDRAPARYLEGGPDLADLGARLSAGEIRLWLVAPEALREDTAMPAYYAAGQRTGADDPLHGGPRLTAAEIEDLVAYLAGLGAAE